MVLYRICARHIAVAPWLARERRVGHRASVAGPSPAPTGGSCQTAAPPPEFTADLYRTRPALLRVNAGDSTSMFVFFLMKSRQALVCWLAGKVDAASWQAMAWRQEG